MVGGWEQWGDGAGRGAAGAIRTQAQVFGRLCPIAEHGEGRENQDLARAEGRRCPSWTTGRWGWRPGTSVSPTGPTRAGRSLRSDAASATEPMRLREEPADFRDPDRLAPCGTGQGAGHELVMGSILRHDSADRPAWRNIPFTKSWTRCTIRVEAGRCRSRHVASAPVYSLGPRYCCSGAYDCGMSVWRYRPAAKAALRFARLSPSVTWCSLGKDWD
jgi:hypothetical protein